jgi:hypothetical protein
MRLCRRTHNLVARKGIRESEVLLEKKAFYRVRRELTGGCIVGDGVAYHHEKVGCWITCAEVWALRVQVVGWTAHRSFRKGYHSGIIKDAIREVPRYSVSSSK